MKLRSWSDRFYKTAPMNSKAPETSTLQQPKIVGSAQHHGFHPAFLTIDILAHQRQPKTGSKFSKLSFSYSIFFFHSDSEILVNKEIPKQRPGQASGCSGSRVFRWVLRHHTFNLQDGLDIPELWQPSVRGIPRGTRQKHGEFHDSWFFFSTILGWNDRLNYPEMMCLYEAWNPKSEKQVTRIYTVLQMINGVEIFLHQSLKAWKTHGWQISTKPPDLKVKPWLKWTYFHHGSCYIFFWGGHFYQMNFRSR